MRQARLDLVDVTGTEQEPTFETTNWLNPKLKFWIP
jgi:hypothetical protein